MAAQRIAIVGGTGQLGQALALRLAAAGHPVLIGSRAAERALAAAAGLARTPGAPVIGVENSKACQDGELVFVTVPYEAQTSTLAPLADVCAGKVVVCCTAPIDFAGGGPAPVRVDAGSAAQECAALLPGSDVVAGLQWVPSGALRRGHPLDMDVPLVGDDEAAVATAARVVASIEGLRPLPAGSLRLAASLEGLTPLLLSINARYRVQSGVRLTGLPERER